MATFSINLASSVPGFSPSQKQLDDTKVLLESYCSYLDDGIDIKIFPVPHLVTSGAAFESLICLACGKKLNDTRMTITTSGGTKWKSKSTNRMIR